MWSIGIEMDPIILSLVTIAVTGGAAFGGVKVGLNGAKNKIKEIDDKLSIHILHEDRLEVEVADRLARLETKIDALR